MAVNFTRWPAAQAPATDAAGPCCLVNSSVPTQVGVPTKRLLGWHRDVY